MIEFSDIKNYDTFKKIEAINKGWSSDKKYFVETVDSRHLLLRIADICEYERKKTEFEMMDKVFALGVPMQQPIDFGTCGSGKNVYQLLSWVEGEDADVAVPRLEKEMQYSLGVTAGKVLKKIQSISIFAPSMEWAEACGQKHRRYIQNYRDCGKSFERDELIIRYIEEHQHLLDNRPMCFSHDDFCLGNLILTHKNELAVIDFQRFRKVDPYHAMNGLMFSAKKSPSFATGQVHGYFDGNPPIDFWKHLLLHTAALTLNFFTAAIIAGKKEIDFASEQICDVLTWYDNMRLVIPKWYDA